MEEVYAEIKFLSRSESFGLIQYNMGGGGGLMARLQQDQDLSIPGFLGRDFAKSRDPRIFQDGIVLNFLSRDFTKKV